MYRLLIVVAVLFLASCATLPPPVSIDQALSMANEGKTPDSIILAMRESRTSYRLTASDIVRLHEKGLPLPVLDYMQGTQIEEVRQDQFLQDATTPHGPSYWRRWWW